jgi:methionine synthase II (cobalamin-independent)
MKQSTNRILTTHAGRLDGPPELMQLTREMMGGRKVEPQELGSKTRNGIAHVIRNQVNAGIDVISDGELTKQVRFRRSRILQPAFERLGKQTAEDGRGAVYGHADERTP